MNAKHWAKVAYAKLGKTIYGKQAIILADDKQSIKITKAGTGVLAKALANSPECVVGIYDINASQADIYDDLIAAGMAA